MSKTEQHLLSDLSPSNRLHNCGHCNRLRTINRIHILCISSLVFSRLGAIESESNLSWTFSSVVEVEHKTFRLYSVFRELALWDLLLGFLLYTPCVCYGQRVPVVVVTDDYFLCQILECHLRCCPDGG